MNLFFNLYTAFTYVINSGIGVVVDGCYISGRLQRPHHAIAVQKHLFPDEQSPANAPIMIEQE